MEVIGHVGKFYNEAQNIVEFSGQSGQRRDKFCFIQVGLCVCGVHTKLLAMHLMSSRIYLTKFLLSLF